MKLLEENKMDIDLFENKTKVSTKEIAIFRRP